jgi:lauroyl/myristoyl acyltransferase
VTAPTSSPAAPPHAPVLGLSHRILGRFHVTGVFWYQFPDWAISRLPAWIDGTVTLLFTLFFFVLLGRIRKAIASNLEPVLGRAGFWGRWWRSLRTMRSFSWCYAERYRMVRQPELFRAALEGEEHWHRAVESGAGVVLVTAHIGPWENGVRFGASDVRRRVHLVREKEMDPRAQTFIEGLLARSGGDYVTHFADSDPALGLELVKALRQGDLVALQGDRPRTGGRAVDVGLFGRSFALPIGPAALARSAEVAMLPVFNFRDGRFRMRSVVRPAIHVARTGDRDRDIEQALRSLAGEIEWAIRQRPFQWFCFRRLWD